MVNELKNKKVLVVGMGKSGLSAVEVLLKVGAKVSVQDSKEENAIETETVEYLKKNCENCFFGEKPEGQFDLLVLSPGVPPALDFVREYAEKGTEIIGELELAYMVSDSTFVAITGTNGKTTTTTLVGEIFKRAGKDSYTVGNIGVPVASAAVDAKKGSYMVTEVSSFQLETTKRFKPIVSALLNLTPDHLNRHGDMEGYGAAKAKVYANQTKENYYVVNYDDPESMKWAEKCPATVVPFSRIVELPFGAFVKDGKIVILNEKKELIEFCGVDELQIPGTHNLENALAAAAIAYFAGIDVAVITAELREFMGVEHRIEFCDEIKGVRFVNDSKGTNPDAAIKAIEAMKGGIILIAGGYDKGSNFDEFVTHFGDKVKHVMLLGVTAPKLLESCEKIGYKNTHMVKDLEECVREGYKLASAGDTVLLSPACASWDMYPNYEVRGKHFKSIVGELKLEESGK